MTRKQDRVKAAARALEVSEDFVSYVLEAKPRLSAFISEDEVRVSKLKEIQLTPVEIYRDLLKIDRQQFRRIERRKGFPNPEDWEGKVTRKWDLQEVERVLNYVSERIDRPRPFPPPKPKPR